MLKYSEYNIKSNGSSHTNDAVWISISDRGQNVNEG